MADSKHPFRDPLTDEALGAAYRSARGTAGGHVLESDWERLMCDELSHSERERALAHIMSCAECRTIHRSLIVVRQEARSIDTAAVMPAVTTRSRHWAIIGGLAAAAIIVIAVMIDRPSRLRDDASDVTRSQGRSASLNVIAPAANATLIDRRFTWQAVAGAETYEVRVHFADGGRVWSDRVTTTDATLPTDVALAPGAYSWQVSAFRDGATIASSAIVPFSVQ